MLSLKVKKREKLGRKVKVLRNKGILPAVLYGPKIKNLNIEIDIREFEKIFKEAGKSSLISLEIDSLANSKQVNKFSVLIHEIKKDPLTGKPIHVDFYQPILTKEVEATVPIVFEGESSAVEDLGGTLIREISELQVKALPQNLPHEIKVSIKSLKALEDEILIKDLKLPEGVKIQREPDEIVAIVTPPEKVEEELEKPIEEKVEEVGEVEEKREGQEEEKKPSESPSDNQADLPRRVKAGKEEKKDEK